MTPRTPTAAQRAAIESEHAQILCIAGPGSGKTETLANRVRKLVERGVDPRKIAVVTYTNQAARNLEERIGKCLACGGKGWTAKYPLNYDLPEQEQCRCEGQSMTLGWAGTLHGLGLRMLRKHGVALGWGERTAVIDDDAAADLLASNAKSMGCKTPLKELLERKKAGEPQWHQIHTNGTPRRMNEEELTVAAYFADLRESGLVDFDLILAEFLRLLNGPAIGLITISREFTDLLVDEVQDCNATDWAIFRAFPAARKFFVGDPRQAIFGFRGGSVGEMVRFGADPETQMLHLAENFRCGSDICAAANRLMVGTFDGTSTISATGQTGDIGVTCLSETEGAEIAFVIEQVKRHCRLEPQSGASQFAVLARTNAIADAFREGLKAAGLPVVEPPKSELPRDWALARAFVECAAQPRNDTLSYFYLLELLRSKGASEKDARQEAHAKQLAARRAGKPLIDTPPWSSFDGLNQSLDADCITRETRALVAKLTRTLPPDATLADLALEMARFKADEQEATGKGVTCTTIHNAKGREWDVVFLVGFEDEVIPGNRKSDGPDELEEERRLAFVGITRARHRVVFTSSKTRRANWGRQELQQHTPSRFIGEALS